MISVVLDTDGLLGLFNPLDNQADRAVELAERLADAGAEFWVLPTTLAEFALLASSRVGVDRTKSALRQIEEMCFGVLDVNRPLLREAMKLYDKQTSKEESLFDCLVMVGAESVGAQYIFSFDLGYKKNGYQLASDFGK